MMLSVFQVNRRGPGLGTWKVLFWWTFMTFLMRVGHVLLYRYRCYGKEHVPRNGPVLMISNHQSNYDPSLVGALVCDRPFKGLARETLFTSKVLTFLMHQFGVISIKQGESDTSAIRSVLAELKVGRCVLLFPEGTRTKDGQIGDFQRGFWLMLRKSKAPVLPLAIEGAYEVWSIGSKPSLRGCIEVAAGEPIDANSLLAMGEEDGTEFVRSTIEALRLKCRERIDQRSKK